MITINQQIRKSSISVNVVINRYFFNKDFLVANSAPTNSLKFTKKKPKTDGNVR